MDLPQPSKDSESEPTPPSKDSESEPTPPSKDSESEPTPPSKDSESEPTPPCKDSKSEPTPPFKDSESEPTPPSKDSESVPTASSKDSESEHTYFIVDESDDEETIAQEEAMEQEIDPQEELRILASDMDVVIVDVDEPGPSRPRRSRRQHKKVDYKAMYHELLLQKKNVALQSPKSLALLCSEASKDLKAGPSSRTRDTNDTTVDSDLTKFYLMNSLPNSDDEVGDEDYKPLRPGIFKESRTGPKYQADIPENLPSNTSVDDDSQLVWKPHSELSDEEIKEYLNKINSFLQHQQLIGTFSRTKHADNEEALQILMQCDFNVERAFDVFKQDWQLTTNIGENIGKSNGRET